MFFLRTDTPHESSDANDNGAHDGRIHLPVFRLCIPAASRRPDVFGVAVRAVSTWSSYAERRWTWNSRTGFCRRRPGEIVSTVYVWY